MVGGGWRTIFLDFSPLHTCGTGSNFDFVHIFQEWVGGKHQLVNNEWEKTQEPPKSCLAAKQEAAPFFGALKTPFFMGVFFYVFFSNGWIR